MISPHQITAPWLVDALHRVYGTDGPPTGYEFPGLTLESARDPIPQLAKQLQSARLGLPMKQALAEALADTTLHRFDADFADAVMTALVRLIDYFGSPATNHILLLKLVRGEFASASPYLLQRVASVGARQQAKLRSRFEEGLKNCVDDENLAVELAIPFLRTEIEEDPEVWLDAALARLAEVNAMADAGDNILAITLGALCADGRHLAVLTGLASGRSPEHEPVLEVLFGRNLPGARLEFSGDYVTTDAALTITLDLHQHSILVHDFLALRPRESVTDAYTMAEEFIRLEEKESWWQTLERYVPDYTVREAA
ncbi:MAG TPA: hypothetical protein VF702_13475 [Allosphingosinicella sp.]|jgi:hypothetical protein